MSKLVIVGTVAFDAIETPFGKTDKILGGAATFIGLAASQFNVDAAVVSIVGGDFPKEYLDLLSNRNIDISGIEIVKEGKTFFWSGKYHNDMNSRDTLATELNVLADFNPMVPEDYKDADIVMLGNLHPNVQLSVLGQMNKKPQLVILDTMNFWMDCALPELHNVMKKVDVITINDAEARQLTGEYSLVVAARKIHEMGPKYVVIKKGEHGATGAGDTFAGGFAGYLAKTEDVSFENMKNAIIYGSTLASFCVEKFGTERMVDLSSKDVYKRLQQFKSLTQFNVELV
jgi:sugar/nucleoside kinase (ribokinase family)